MNRPPDLGRRLRAAREYKGLSQAALADAITGVSQSSVVRYEKGELPDDRKLAGLLEDWARVCEVPDDWFSAPWGQVGRTDETTHASDEPAWVGRLEDHLMLILNVLRAGSDAEAEAAMGQLAGGDDRQPRSASRRKAPAKSSARRKTG